MGSDRTQRLSVELERGEIEAVAISLEPAEAYAAVVNKLRAALSQPEQGETPSLVLGDEIRCRLWRIAAGLQAAMPHPKLTSEDATFLRNLASQERTTPDLRDQLQQPIVIDAVARMLCPDEEQWKEGGDAYREQAERIATGLPSLLSVASQEHRGEEGLVTRLRSDEAWDAAESAIAAAIQERRGDRSMAISAVEAALAVAASGFSYEPSTGEAARLRERLKNPIHALASTIGRARVHLDAHSLALAKRELNGAAEAMGWLRNALPAAPSDSQGGQRCTCEVEPIYGHEPRCPNRDPASTQGEGRLSRHVERGSAEVRSWPSYPAAEGGGEEDWWAEIRMLRYAAENIEAQFPGFADGLLKLADKLSALPAAVPSEPSVLEEERDALFDQAVTRGDRVILLEREVVNLRKALLRKDLDEAGVLDEDSVDLDDLTYNELKERVSRAETALEELAAKASENADEAEARWQANTDELEYRGAMHAHLANAKRLREKAAALKGGEGRG